MSMPTNSMYMGCTVLISLNTIIHINRKTVSDFIKKHKGFPDSQKQSHSKTTMLPMHLKKELIYRIYKELKN